MTALAIQPAAPANREEWVRARRSGIGGSDAAVVMGVSTRKSAYSLWCEKAGLVESDFSDNEVLRWGRIMEAPIAEDYERITGRKLIDLGPHAIQRNPDRPWQICTHDRLIEPIDARGRGVLSIKYIGPISARGWEEMWVEQQGPVDYKIQAQHEMLVSGLTWGSFAVFIWGHGVQWTDYELNRNFADALIDEEADFWRRVQEGDPPAIDGSESTREALKRLFPRDSGLVLEASDEILPTLRELRAAKADAKAAKARITQFENEIKGLMGDASDLRVGGQTVATWRMSERKAYEVKANKSRTFRLKGDDTE